MCVTSRGTTACSSPRASPRPPPKPPRSRPSTLRPPTTPRPRAPPVGSSARRARTKRRHDEDSLPNNRAAPRGRHRRHRGGNRPQHSSTRTTADGGRTTNGTWFRSDSSGSRLGSPPLLLRIRRRTHRPPAGLRLAVCRSKGGKYLKTLKPPFFVTGVINNRPLVLVWQFRL